MTRFVLYSTAAGWLSSALTAERIAMHFQIKVQCGDFFNPEEGATLMVFGKKKYIFTKMY